MFIQVLFSGLDNSNMEQPFVQVELHVNLVCLDKYPERLKHDHGSFFLARLP